MKALDVIKGKVARVRSMSEGSIQTASADDGAQVSSTSVSYELHPAATSARAASPYMTREDKIVSNAAKAQEDLALPKKKFTLRRRKKMPYRLKLALFCAVMFCLMLAYILDFCLGDRFFASVNDWTDSVAEGAVHGICAGAAAVFGGDWSGRELALWRLLTLGCTSYVLFSFFVSLVVSGIVALLWSWKATGAADDDGTSNFVAEKPRF